TFVIGHLSLFSVMFISIVIGIGIDYGIYFLFRYEEELFLGRNLREAIEITAGRSGPGMLLGAVTAAGTFYVLRLTEFRGVQEHAALRRLRTVSEVDSALLLIPDDQPAKLKIIRDFAPIVAPIRVGRATPVDIERLLAALETLRRRFGIAANEAPEGETKLRL